MVAPILLNEYRMKKEKAHRVKIESEAPVTLEFMREFQATMLSKFSEVNARFAGLDAKIAGLDAKFTGLDAKIDKIAAETQTAIHQVKVLVEEQNTRNRQAYDGYAITYGALQDLKNRIKPECLKD